MNILDYSNLPDLSVSKVFITLEKDIHTSLVKFRRTYERALSATNFCWFFNGDHEMFHCKEEKLLSLKEAFLRAALAEFVSMEDMLRSDLQELNRMKGDSKFLKINNTTSPLLHIMRELRNYEFHLQTNKIVQSKRIAYIGNSSNPEEAKKLEVEIFTIQELKVIEFKKLTNSKNYSDKEIVKLLSWFNGAQKKWGIDDLLEKAIEKYCYEIINYYKL